MKKFDVDLSEILNGKEDLPQELRERIGNFVERLRSRRDAISFKKNIDAKGLLESIGAKNEVQQKLIDELITDLESEVV